jgi:hypothetical protein
MEEQDQGCNRTSGNTVALRETIQQAEVRRYRGATYARKE